MDWLPLCWIQSSAMFCLIQGAVFQHYKPIFKYQGSPHKNLEFCRLFKKKKKTWHPLDLYSHISTTFWAWVVAALLRPGLPRLAHTPAIILRHQGQVLGAIYHCYCLLCELKKRSISLCPCVCQQQENKRLREHDSRKMGERMLLCRSEDIPVCLKCQHWAPWAICITCLAPVATWIHQTCAPHKQRKTRENGELAVAGLLESGLQWP